MMFLLSKSFINSIFQESKFECLCVLDMWLLIDLTAEMCFEIICSEKRAHDFISDNCTCITLILLLKQHFVCVSSHHAWLCTVHEPHENLTWKQSFLNQIRLPVFNGNKPFSPLLIFILSHIMHAKSISANLRIMTVHPFLPSHYSSNAVWVTSVAFPLTKIIAQQENKSFQIVSWHKHFGSFLYYN